jgi:hypothetical protein
MVKVSTSVNKSNRDRTEIISTYLNKIARIDTSRALQVGMILRPPAQTILDTVK